MEGKDKSHNYGFFINKKLSDLRAIKKVYEDEIKCRQNKLLVIEEIIKERKELKPGSRFFVTFRTDLPETQRSSLDISGEWLMIVRPHDVAHFIVPAVHLETGRVYHFDRSMWTIEPLE